VGVAERVLWHFGQLALLAVIMLTINKRVMNALGKRTLLVTVLHIVILGLLAVLCAAVEGLSGNTVTRSTSREFAKSATLAYHLTFAYHALFLLVTLYLTAIFSIWVRKLKSTKVRSDPSHVYLSL
jgi:hypothetical protein